MSGRLPRGMTAAAVEKALARARAAFYVRYDPGGAVWVVGRCGGATGRRPEDRPGRDLSAWADRELRKRIAFAALESLGVDWRDFEWHLILGGTAEEIVAAILGWEAERREACRVTAPFRTVASTMTARLLKMGA